MNSAQRGWGLLAKRALDIGASLGLIAATSPMMILASLSIRATLGSPVLFRQVRPGRHGRPFTVLKFRTMRDGGGSDLDRLTRIGRVLRRTSLDEMPQLFNVLRGEMSLVGPRPLLMEYLELYTPEQARRHDVLPGITGWAQVNGRNGITHEQRFELDLWYVHHWSFGLDLLILAKTLAAVLSRRGINAEGEATMPVFRGSRPDARRERAVNGKSEPACDTLQ